MAARFRRPRARVERSAAGAVGVCVAKVGEAEVMAAAGVRNLLITTEVVGPEKIGRLLGVLRRQPETLVVVDNRDNVQEVGDAVAKAGLVLNVLVDVDVGGRRTGTQPQSRRERSFQCRMAAVRERDKRRGTQDLSSQL